ncbi:MAG: hypothetical protein WB471_00365 [Nocardioides sp.]
MTFDRGRRDLRVDVVRGLALLSMYVAHCAPTGGPAGVLTLSEYLTYPLFAALVGGGAQLSDRRLIGPGSFQVWRTVAVRGAVLVGLGLLLEQAGAQVVIVLVHLGLLTWVAAPLARARTSVVAAVATAAYVLAPMVHDALLVHRGQLMGEDSSTQLRVLDLLVTGQSYRLSSMIFFAALGILLTRLLLDCGTTTQLRGGLVLAGFAGLLLVADRADLVTLAAYDTTHAEHLLDALLVSAVFLLGVALAALAPRSTRSLAAIGQMSLTLYAAQISWLAYEVTVLHPGSRDDSWVNVTILVSGSFLLALAWRTSVRREVWRRGPLEGLTALLAGTTRRPAESPRPGLQPPPRLVP